MRPGPAGTALALILACAGAIPGSASGSDEALRVVPDPLVREGVVFRVRVDGAVPAACRYLTVSLVDGDRVLAATELAADQAQIAVGVTAALVPQETGRSPSVLVRAADGGHLALIRRSVAVSSIAGLVEAAVAAKQRLGAGSAPLPHLRLEQITELLQTPVPTVADMQTVHVLLGQLADGTDAGSAATRVLAFTDPVDGSVQPVRLTLPAGSSADGLPLVLVAHGVAATKARWEPLPSAWCIAAATAGVAIAEVFPAGDAGFVGAARRRVPLAEAAVRAAVPGLGAARVIAADDSLAQPESWRRPHPLAPAEPLTRLARWAEAPFVVIVGTGEHTAARADARRLADAFVQAWAAHAQGLPPVIDDTAFRARDWPGANLVLVGSPRGNAVAAGWARRLPLNWDDRTVRLGDRLCHRSRLPGVAVAIPHPDDPARTVLLLDGSPAWRGPPGDLPLRQEARDADLLLLPGDPGEGAPVRLLLEARPAGP